MKFKTLFSIHIKHSYFAPSSSSSVDQYLELLPDNNTQQLMSRMRLRLMRRPDRLLLLTNTTNKLKSQKLKFCFFLNVKNSDFFHFTNFSLAPYDQIDKVLSRLTTPYYTNKNTNPTLQLSTYKHDAIDTFSVPKERLDKKEAIDSFFLKNRPLEEATKDSFEIIGLKNIAFHPNAYHPNLKRIQFDASSYEKNKVFQVKYRSIPNWNPSILGLVEIESTFDEDNPKYDTDYNISFEAKKEKWEYLFITQSNIRSRNLKIKNKILEFEQTKEITTGEDFDRIKLVHKDAKLFSIVSKNVIEYSNLIIQKINLRRKNTILIEHLPNPRPKDGGRAIINIYSLNKAS